MTFQVMYLGETIQTLPLDSLVLYRIAFEKNGFYTSWDTNTQTLYLSSTSSSKKISLITPHDSDDSDLTNQFKKQFIHFMDYLPMECLVGEENQDNDLTVQVKTEYKAITSPRVAISYNMKQNAFDKAYKTYHKDLADQLDVTYHPIRNSFDKMQIRINIDLPKNVKQQDINLSPLSMFLATAICHNFVQETESYHTLSKQFLFSILNFKEQTAPSPPFIHKNEEENKQEAEQQEDHHSPLQQTESAPSINTEEEEEFVDLDVYFNYTLHPAREKEQYTAYGELILKNRGNVDVQSPVICLKATPVDQVDLGGQIIPPDMADLLGVNSSDGLKGWKYVDKDWLTKAKDKGEYWISPIDFTEIPADETITLPNLQITIKPKEDEQERVVIKAAVYFHDVDQPFISENAISISF